MTRRLQALQAKRPSEWQLGPDTLSCSDCSGALRPAIGAARQSLRLGLATGYVTSHTERAKKATEITSTTRPPRQGPARDTTATTGRRRHGNEGRRCNEATRRTTDDDDDGNPQPCGARRESQPANPHQRAAKARSQPGPRAHAPPPDTRIPQATPRPTSSQEAQQPEKTTARQRREAPREERGVVVWGVE